MMKKTSFAALMIAVALPVYAADESGEFLGLDIDEDDVGVVVADDNLPKKNEKVLSNFISSRISSATAENIEKAEKVFCYTIDLPEAEYNGYKIHGMKITGSCGELSKEGINLFQTAVLNNGYAFSSSTESCVISPKILLRYFYGIDSTDVIFSSPCHSLTFFHDNEAVILNASPSKEIIDELVKAYSGLSEKFLSPALMDQMVANGMAVSQGQKELVRKNSAAPSLKKWENQSNTPQNASAPAAANTSGASQPVKKGWSKLNK